MRFLFQLACALNKALCRSRSSKSIVLLPLRQPLLDPVDIGLHLVGVGALELDDNLLVVRVPRLLDEHVHDLRVYVFLELDLGVFSFVAVSFLSVWEGWKTGKRSGKKKRDKVPRRQPIIKRLGVHPQHDNQINPGLGEQVAGVPVYYEAALLGLFFDGV